MLKVARWPCLSRAQFLWRASATQPPWNRCYSISTFQPGLAPILEGFRLVTARFQPLLSTIVGCPEVQSLAGRVQGRGADTTSLKSPHRLLLDPMTPTQILLVWNVFKIDFRTNSSCCLPIGCAWRNPLICAQKIPASRVVSGDGASGLEERNRLRQRRGYIEDPNDVRPEDN
ncbi:uncharacterized protein [Henckelia pumila]|uniref:uncharacterized protein isoform X4 n=1 Tax=Henckelia pumila TaxID=405737 RepID=UPI003C6E19C0